MFSDIVLGAIFFVPVVNARSGVDNGFTIGAYYVYSSGSSSFSAYFYNNGFSSSASYPEQMVLTATSASVSAQEAIVSWANGTSKFNTEA